MNKIRTLFLVGMAVAGLAVPVRAQYVTTTIDPDGSTGTYVNGCSGASVVGFYSDADFVFHGFLFTGGTTTTIDPTGSEFTTVNAISGSNLVGYYQDVNGVTHGFIYNGTTYTTLDPPGSAYTVATGVSGSTVVGNYQDSSGVFHGFEYVGGTYTTIDPTGTTGTTVTGCSGSNVVGFYTDASNLSHGFLYNGTTYTTLDPTGSTNTGASCVSGSVVAGTFTDGLGTHGFTYSSGTFTTIDAPSSTSTTVSGISGSNVVGYFTDANGTHAFIENAGTFTTIDAPNSDSTFGTAGSGTNVAGYYQDSGGTSHGFISTLPASAQIAITAPGVTYDGNPHGVTVTTTPAGLANSVAYTDESTSTTSSTPPTDAGTYDVVATITDPSYQGSATGTLTIAQASQTITFTAPSTGIAGQTITLGGTASSGLSVTYSFDPTDPTVQTTTNATLSSNALTFTDSGPVTVYAYQAGDGNYTAAATVAQTITGYLPATVILSGLTAVYDGTRHAVTATTDPTGLNVTLTYQPVGGAVTTTAPIAVGFYTVVATVVDSTYAGSATATLVIGQASSITKQPISQRIAPGGTATFTATSSGFPAPSVQWQVSTDGGATFQDIAGATGTTLTFITNVSQNGNIYQAVFTNTASTTTSHEALLVVDATTKPKATATLSGLSAAYNGSPHPVTVTTNPPGLDVVVLYNGSTVAPTTAGSYPLAATIVDATYQGGITGTLVITKGTATVALSNLAATYDGTPQTPTTTTTPSGLAVALTYGTSTVAPTNAGSYAVTATVSDPDYQGVGKGTFVIAKSTGTVTLSNLAKTYTGAVQGATATTTPAGLPVTFVYNGSTTVHPTNAGSYSVVATINSANATGSTTGTLVISQAPATLTLGGLTRAYTGAGIAPTATTVPAGRPVTYLYNGNSAVAPVLVGTYSVVATINAINYTGTATGTLTITPIAPVVGTQAATAISASGATLNGLVNPKGSSASVTYQYGATTAYGLTTASQPLSPGTVAVGVPITVGTLTPRTLYHFRIVATNASNMTTIGADKTFTTLAVPVFGTDPATPLLSASGARIGFSVNPSGLATTVYFQYGTTTSYGSQTTSQSIGAGNAAVNVGAFLPGLTASTTYHYRLVAVNAAGTFYGPDETVTTLGFDTTLVAQKGDAAAGSTFAALGNPIINDSDAVAFSGTLMVTGTTTAAKAVGIWTAAANGSPQLVAQTGSGFLTLSDPVFNDAGAVAFRATVAGAGTAMVPAIWANNTGTLTKVAQQGDLAGTGSATFNTFTGLVLPDTSAGGPIYVATLNHSASLGIDSTNDTGIWSGLASASNGPLVRLGDTIDGKVLSQFNLFPIPPTAIGQSRAYSQANASLIFSATFSDASTALVAFVGGPAIVCDSSTPVPGVTGATFSVYGSPIINNNMHISFLAILTGTGITASNNTGIWSDTAADTSQLIARTGIAGSAPDTNNAMFSALNAPVYNNNQATAFRGTLAIVSGQATAATATGIWCNSTGALHLVARQGDQAPECPTGATFASFAQLALPDQGGATSQGGTIFLATLNVNATAGVSAANNTGIWAVDSTGTLQLIVRTGDVLEDRSGNPKVVTALSFLPTVTTVNGQTRSFDPTSGDLLYLATFSDKTTAIYNVVFP